MKGTPKKRLTDRQKKNLLVWISEGLQSDEINKRAAHCKPPFEVSRRVVDFYRKRSAVKLAEITEVKEMSALKTGLALRAERVAKLQQLAAKMEDDILGERLWVKDVKSVGSGFAQTIVEYEVFNAAEVQQYRATLDDIAKEVGDRRQKVDVKIDAREALAKFLGVPVEDLPADTSADA